MIKKQHNIHIKIQYEAKTKSELDIITNSCHLSTLEPPMILALVKLSSGDQSFFWSSLDKLLRSVAPRRSCLGIKVLFQGLRLITTQQWTVKFQTFCY